MNQQIAAFLREALNRLGTKSPKFFFILKTIALILSGAGYLPTILSWFGIEALPQSFKDFLERVAFTSAGLFFGASFTAESKPTAVTREGNVIKKLDEIKYPYTAQIEQQKAEKLEVPVIKDPIKEE